LSNDAEVTAFFSALNYSSEMGVLYTELLNGWFGLTRGLFNAYYDVGTPGQAGSWGAIRHLTDQNPRWEALVTFVPPVGAQRR
jgi:hypothetical protein